MHNTTPVSLLSLPIKNHDKQLKTNLPFPFWPGPNWSRFTTRNSSEQWPRSVLPFLATVPNPLRALQFSESWENPRISSTRKERNCLFGPQRIPNILVNQEEKPRIFFRGSKIVKSDKISISRLANFFGSPPNHQKTVQNESHSIMLVLVGK